MKRPQALLFRVAPRRGAGGRVRPQSAQLLPAHEVSSIVDGTGSNLLGQIAKLVEAVGDVPNELPAHGRVWMSAGRKSLAGGDGGLLFMSHLQRTEPSLLTPSAQQGH